MSSTETYFVAATIVTAGPTSAWMRSKFARTCSGDIGDRALAPGDAAVAAVGEERLGMAGGALAEPVDARDPGRAEGSLDRAGQVEPPVADESRSEGGADGLGDVVLHLVAAGADPRPDRGRARAAAERLHRGRQDPGEQATPAHVDERERSLEPDERHR